MTNNEANRVMAQRFGERQIIRVCAPTAHAGIGTALRMAFSPPVQNEEKCEFARLLELV